MPLGIFHYGYDFHKCNFAWQTVYILNFKKVFLLFSQKQNFLCAVLTVASFFSSFFHFNVT